MGEGTRTLDSWDHNPVLYQLSYTHPMRQKGFEPLTHGLEGRCSIHLSYWRVEPFLQSPLRQVGPAAPPAWSGRADLNGRPPAPKAGALPGCATPRHGSVPDQREGCDVLALLSYHAVTCRTNRVLVLAPPHTRSLAAQEKTRRTVGKIENRCPIHPEDNSRHTQDCQ